MESDYEIPQITDISYNGKHDELPVLTETGRAVVDENDVCYINGKNLKLILRFNFNCQLLEKFFNYF